MSQRRTLTLCVFIDAFGWEILKKHPFLDDILTTKTPLESVFGYSSTCVPTVLTGKMPREHGHFSFFYYNPAESPFSICRFLSVLPKFFTRRGRVRRMMSKVIQRYYGYDGYFQIYNMPFRELPLFDYSEKKDLYAPGGINTGVPTIFDYFRDNQIPFHVSNWRLPDEENVKALEADLEQRALRFAYLYMASLDGILHDVGKASPRVGERIQWYDRELRRVLDQARKKYHEVRLFVFSDHGQADIHEVMDLMSQIEPLPLKFGLDYVVVYDSTMARFWFLKEGARERIVSVLQGIPRGRILTEEELAAMGCDFPGHKFGELYFLAEPGVLICPSFMGETRLAGMHGYAPDDKDSVAIFSSSVTPPFIPKRLDNLYALMVREATSDS